MSNTAASRSTGLPSNLGKATEEVRTRVPEQVKEDLLRLARSVGLTEAEFVRDVLMVRLYGLEAVQSMTNSRLMVAAGIAPNEAQL